MRGNTSASYVFLRLGIVAALLLGACVGLDEGEGAEDRDLLTVEQELIDFGLSLRVGWDRDAEQVVAAVHLDGADARGAVVLIGNKTDFRSGECFASGRCTSLENVRAQRVNVSFDEGSTREVVRFPLEGERRHGGQVCFQAFTRHDESRVECVRVPRTGAGRGPDPGPLGPDKADGATDSECAAHGDSPETCAATSGCAVGIAEACHDADAACADRTSERTCWQAPECRWSGGACSPRGIEACDVNNTRTACYYTPGCSWFLGQCVKAPVADEESCATGGFCEVPCQLLDAFACVADDTCMAWPDRCDVPACDLNGDSASCEGAGCFWYGSLGICNEVAPIECHEGYDAASCGSIAREWSSFWRGCQWIDALDLCVELPSCSDQHDALSCTNAGCTWYEVMGCI